VVNHEAGAGFTWTERLRLIMVSALQVDKAVLFSALVFVLFSLPHWSRVSVLYLWRLRHPRAPKFSGLLATVVIGGLITSTALTLYLLPIFWS
jgi:cobalt-zinc-cadmium resistance protein CzcA